MVKGNNSVIMCYQIVLPCLPHTLVGSSILGQILPQDVMVHGDALVLPLFLLVCDGHGYTGLQYLNIC